MTRTARDPLFYRHPTAICESEHIGAGTRLWAYVHVMEGAVIGRDCNLGDHSFVEGGARVGDRVTIKNGVMIWTGVTLEDDVFIGPGVIFANDRYPRSPRMTEVAARYRDPEHWLAPTIVRRGASIGAGAVVLPGITIGRYAVVAAAGVVTRDVPDHRLVIGNPAQEARWACVCGAPLDGELRCQLCDRAYRLTQGRLVGAESQKVNAST